MINVILVGSETSGNIGAIARAMANFDLKNLILVNPKVNHLSQESRNRAKHAQGILHNAKVVKRIPKMDFKRVDFPDPDFPMIPRDWPGFKLKFT